jgi:hypothetical protein
MECTQVTWFSSDACGGIGGIITGMQEGQAWGLGKTLVHMCYKSVLCAHIQMSLVHSRISDFTSSRRRSSLIQITFSQFTPSIDCKLYNGSTEHTYRKRIDQFHNLLVSEVSNYSQFVSDKIVEYAQNQCTLRMRLRCISGFSSRVYHIDLFHCRHLCRTCSRSTLATRLEFCKSIHLLRRP